MFFDAGGLNPEAICTETSLCPLETGSVKYDSYLKTVSLVSLFFSA